MRALIGLLVLGVIFYVTAIAQFPDTSADEPVEEVQAINQRAPVEWLATCLVDWDAQTHITKTHWRATCERVARERAHFQLSAASGERKSR
jgi:hypothetical protein